LSLIHVNRSLDLFLTVAARGFRATGMSARFCTSWWMVLKAVDRGWMKILMVDRGLIDGAKTSERLKRDHQVDTVVPLKKNMDAYQTCWG